MAPAQHICRAFGFGADEPSEWKLKPAAKSRKGSISWQAWSNFDTNEVVADLFPTCGQSALRARCLGRRKVRQFCRP
jgi:hypothetical protein